MRSSIVYTLINNRVVVHLRSRVYYMQAALRSGMYTNQNDISNQDLPSSYFAERNLKRGVTLFPY